MSEHSITIVPKISFYPDNKAKTDEILKWFISRDIVKAALSECILSTDEGYAVSEGAKQITDFPEDLPYFLSTNGLEIITNREVFHTGETGMEKCICPNCGEDISQEEWNFIEYWFCHDTDDSLCPLCDVLVSIHQLEIIPPWGFSNLGFKFWNWPDFKPEFINEIQQFLQCDLVIVKQHV